MAEGNVRTRMLMVYFIMCLVTADRQIFNACVDVIQHALGVSLTKMGVLMSAYQWGYLLLNLPGGTLADRVGGLRVLQAAALMWSVALGITPVACSLPLGSSAFLAVFISRLLFGAASGVALPAASSVIGKTLPTEHRATAVTTMFAMFNFGPVIGLASGSLLGIVDWPVLFYAFAGVGIMLLSVTAFAVKAPAASPSTGQALLPAKTSAVDEVGASGTGTLLVGRAYFAFQLASLIVVHSVINMTYALTQYWLPKYFKNDLNMSLASSAGLAALPFVTMAAAAYMCGKEADRLINSGWSKLAVRRLMMGISHLGPAMCLMLLREISDPYVAVGVLMVMNGLHAFNAAGYHAHIQDVAAAKAGTILGTTNTIGVVFSSTSTAVVAHLVQETGSFKLVFSIAAGLYCLGFVIFFACIRPQKLFMD
eukprot:TRINITY_DN41958_c0_g1_i1.p1 TRINITY_DN41958_c0_g1~~TRINITY_DN41958_c0_g1_i1.p1  ORF type:complete len:424 (+),score=49.37 TRINITY_DN41958_c0_g1_i1:53-1324(+)